MRSRRNSMFLMGLSVAVFIVALAAGSGMAEQEQVLHSFTSSNPQAGVTFDAAGNLYGTEGLNIYKLAPQSDGTWLESVIYTFSGFEDAEGTLAHDAAGNLYGVTIAGIGNSGTVFQLTPSGGSWIETTLFTFPANGAVGIDPYGDLVIDSVGNIYGTTFYGGRYGDNSKGGTAWRLSPQSSGGWVFKVLHNFGPATDGQDPRAKLTFDAAGNLYGTTVSGGRYSLGTAFELVPQSNGTWAQKFLHHFGNGTDGADVYSNLIFDSKGNLYGTTLLGGGGNAGGIVFELVPQTNGMWTEKIVHRFGSGTDGNGPLGDITFDASGQLFGTTIGGGANEEGTVWEIKF